MRSLDCQLGEADCFIVKYNGLYCDTPLVFLVKLAGCSHFRSHCTPYKQINISHRLRPVLFLTYRKHWLIEPMASWIIYPIGFFHGSEMDSPSIYTKVGGFFSLW